MSSLRLKPLLITIFIALGAGVAGAWIFNTLQDNGKEQERSRNPQSLFWDEPGLYSSGENPLEIFTRFSGPDTDPEAINAPFRKASAISRPSVVFIKVEFYTRRDVHGDWQRLWDFFGYRGPRTSTGSGVIISEDGYIITNNHVLENAESIEVTLHGRRQTYDAEIIGTDPSTDLALIKIDDRNLPAIDIGNSDEIHVGDWVLAVGNPFNLESTVTAGILSARSRNLNIVRDQFPLESFLQTDAAINPGNSGGALVDLNGKLVGVNTAILSQTGTYTGYGFAIPSNIVSKVATDLREYGIVQRAFLEADIVDIDRRIADRLEKDIRKGVYISSVPSGGNAEEAGLQSGDVILEVNGREITNRAFFKEQIAYHRPGDEISLVISRGRQEHKLDVTLTNRFGTTELVEQRSIKSERLGAEFEEMSPITGRQLDIDHGIRIFNIQQGPLRRVGIPEGFIITHFNRQPFYSPEKLIEAMENTSGRFIIEGYRPDGSRATYSFFAR